MNQLKNSSDRHFIFSPIICTPLLSVKGKSHSKNGLPKMLHVHKQDQTNR